MISRTIYGASFGRSADKCMGYRTVHVNRDLWNHVIRRRVPHMKYGQSHRTLSRRNRTYKPPRTLVFLSWTSYCASFEISNREDVFPLAYVLNNLCMFFSHRLLIHRSVVKMSLSSVYLRLRCTRLLVPKNICPRSDQTYFPGSYIVLSLCNV